MYGPSLWSHILGDQLDVDEAAFWACVRDGVRPSRGAATSARATALPAEVVSLLLHRVGLSDAEVAALTREAAIERLKRFWLEGR